LLLCAVCNVFQAVRKAYHVLGGCYVKSFVLGVLIYGFVTEGLSNGFTSLATPASEFRKQPRRSMPVADAEFWRVHDEAVAEYDARMSGVPLNLRLPGGDTVADRIRAQIGDE